MPESMMAPTGDWIFLSRLAFPCILGLHDREQRREQTLEVEIHLGLDLEPAAGGDLSRSVNYTGILAQVQFIAQQGRWRLLESMAAAMARHLLADPAEGEGRARIDRVRVRLAKPEVYSGRAVPGIEIARERIGSAARSKVGPVQVLQETRETGAYHSDLPGLSECTMPEGATALVVAGAVENSGRRWARGDVLAKGSGTVRNTSDEACRLLVVSLPPITSAGESR
jgi:dihydroneopterin aldolase